MKDSRKITKIQLSVEDPDKPLFIGLVSADPDYKLSLKLNRNLGLALKNDSPVIVDEKGEKETSFSRFIDSTGAPDTVYNLISNRSGKNFLIRQLTNVDYLFMIHDANRELSSDLLLTRLRGTDSVTAVFDIDFSTLKDRNLKYLPL